jgi:hypothetical protein
MLTGFLCALLVALMLRTALFVPHQLRVGLAKFCTSSLAAPARPAAPASGLTGSLDPSALNARPIVEFAAQVQLVALAPRDSPIIMEPAQLVSLIHI